MPPLPIRTHYCYAVTLGTKLCLVEGYKNSECKMQSAELWNNFTFYNRYGANSRRSDSGKNMSPYNLNVLTLFPYYEIALDFSKIICYNLTATQFNIIYFIFCLLFTYK